ncbi:hypothetical protein A2955_02950 [Candidatus Woesebacteria bacterium RIFCSPLOWO2_01_FULL_37_19]|uniref:Lipopolysaccharide assembly protein A domain-containing protein n=2 Tax=Candidatus Woeseibacteriota TaxID=1752722 RepID=A0A1F8BBL2_9BACT|nr:MAG: hypothetical protein A2771_00105 [Candidatus Woesebacteria bacterium RIFCSPHIGHO2_01_FULL_38_26b]OGM61421.1 MAG: hypothetical protein A2955_02950 [Candidatus Woesebacteria bacterium RIFCSPLOWO2_01_FULL_37_19]
MIILILVIVFGITFAYFATQNTAFISLYFGPYVLPNVPIYLVILGSMACSILIAGIVYLVRSLASNLTLSEKEGQLKSLKKELAEVTRTAHKLELENAKLKSKAGVEDFDDESF